MTLSRTQGRVLAAAFAAAWISCPLVEPIPDGPEPALSWLDLIAVAGLVTIVAAVVTIARGTQRAAWYGVSAGVCMVALTITCPASGHHQVGWWTWWQSAMSGFVLVVSAALVFASRTRAEPVAAPTFAAPVAVRQPDVVHGWSPRVERPEPVRPGARARRDRSKVDTRS